VIKKWSSCKQTGVDRRNDRQNEMGSSRLMTSSTLLQDQRSDLQMAPAGIRACKKTGGDRQNDGQNEMGKRKQHRWNVNKLVGVDDIAGRMNGGHANKLAGIEEMTGRMK